MGSRDHSFTCEVCGFQRGGLNDLVCMCDAWREAAACALLTLAENLAIGGALCKAWLLGLVPPEHGACDAYFCTYERWFPGCGRSAP